jgi:hypothetical protein
MQLAPLVVIQDRSQPPACQGQLRPYTRGMLSTTCHHSHHGLPKAVSVVSLVTLCGPYMAAEKGYMFFRALRALGPGPHTTRVCVQKVYPSALGGICGVRTLLNGAYALPQLHTGESVRCWGVLVIDLGRLLVV